MSITFKNLPQFQAQLVAAVGTLTSPKAMDAIALESIEIIKERTRAGDDVRGASFADYSHTPLYISLKHRPAPRGGIRTPQTARKVANYNGRAGASHSLGRATSRGGKSMFFPGGYRQYRSGFNSTVSLEATGNMLRSLRFRPAGRSRVLFFGGAAIENNKAIGHNTGHGKLPRREFMGVGKAPGEAARIKAAWEKANGKL